MQSGSHMKTFYNTIAHQGKEIVGILIDSTNHSMVTADQNTVVLWDFFSGIYQQKVELSSDISMLVPDANSSIFGVVTHNEISLMELHSLRQVRTFIGHKGVINDCCIIFSERKLITCGSDNSLCVWDIFTEKLVSKYKLEKEIISLTISPDLVFLACVFKDDKHIMLWHINKLGLFNPKPVKVKFLSYLNFVGEDKRQHYFGEKSSENEGNQEPLEDIDEQLYAELEEAMDHHESGNQASSSSRSALLGFTDIPQNKWMPLNYIEQIEQRNKPEKNQTVEVPFFLDFDNPLSRMKQEVEAEVMKKEVKVTSKIIRTSKKNTNLEEIGDEPNRILDTISLDEPLSKEMKKIHRQLFLTLKKMGAQQLHYFFRSSVFADPTNSTKLLCVFHTLFKSPIEFDLKTVFFKSFLECSYDKIGTQDMDKVIFSKICENQKRYSLKLDSDYNFLSCLLDRFSIISK